MHSKMCFVFFGKPSKMKADTLFKKCIRAVLCWLCHMKLQDDCSDYYNIFLNKASIVSIKPVCNFFFFITKAVSFHNC